MAIIRQMPNLYLRGSLANVTMKNLTKDEMVFCDKIVDIVLHHKDIQKHRHKVARVLGETIGADYRSDKNTADQEFKIAIWKAVVNLFFHKHYKFKCKSCNSTHRITKTTGLPKAIDQEHIPCPVCNKVEILDPGDTHFVSGQFVDHFEYQESYKDFAVGIPSIKSTIKAEPKEYYNEEETIKKFENGEINEEVYNRRLRQYRYDNPSIIIEDDIQLTKFFSEFVWGYFKQQLLENKITSKKEKLEISARADIIIVNEIVSTANKLKLKIDYCKNTQPEHGWWNITANSLSMPPEFTFFLIEILEKASLHNVHVEIMDSVIRIKEDCCLGYIDGIVYNPENITVMEQPHGSISENGDNALFIDQLNFKTVGENKVYNENHIQYIDNSDTLSMIFEMLPDGDCRKIFQIYVQSGEIYESFRQEFGYDSEAKQIHMARFLNIPPRIVKQHIETIKHVCLANDLSPTTV